MPLPVVISDSQTLESGFRGAHNDTARAVPIAGYLDPVTKYFYLTNIDTDELFYVDLSALALLEEVPPVGAGTGENPNGSATTETEGVVFLADPDNPADMQSDRKVGAMSLITQLLEQYIQNVASPGLDQVLQNDNLSKLTAYLGGLSLLSLQTVTSPTCIAVLEQQADKTWCLKATDPENIVPKDPLPTIPNTIQDQTYIVGVPFTVQFDPFPGATRHVFSAPPTGFVRDEVNRVISGTSSKLGGTIVKYTGINSGGEVSVDILFTGIPQPVPQQITDVYWADNGGTSLSLYGFGNAEPQDMLFQILDPADDSVIIAEQAFLYEPNKYDKPGLFVGYAPYTSLVLGLTTGEDYKFKARIEGSDNYVEETFTYASGQKGKIYPLISDVLAFKDAIASSNNGDADLSNDGDSGTFYVSTATSQQAIQIDAGGNFQFSTIPVNVGDGTVNFWIIGYPSSVAPPDISAPLTTAINWPGITFLKSYAGPFSGGLYTIGEDDGLPGKVFRHLRIQKADSSALKIQVEGYGTPVANTPPNLVSPIPAQVDTEGDPFTFDVRPYFADANLDLLDYTVKILDADGNPTVDNYDWNPFVAGVFNSPAVEFEGSGGTAHVTRYRVFASDGQAQVSGDFTLTINKRATVPAGLTRAAITFDTNNKYITGFLQLASGTATLEITGVGFTYPQGSPAKGMGGGGPFTVLGESYGLRATGFAGGEAGKTYKAKYTTPNGIYEKQFTIPIGVGNPSIKLYPDAGSGTGASVTNVYWDAARLASEKKLTAFSEASELNQFQLKKTDGTIIYNFVDGTLTSGVYQYVSNIVLTDGGYLLTSRIKTDPNIFKTEAFTISSVVAQIIKIGIAPNSITDGICRSVRMYAQVTTGHVEEAWYAYPNDFLQMDVGTYPQDYNRAANAAGDAGSGISFETAREFKFRVKGTTDVISVNYARNGDAVGIIRQVYPFRPADAPVQNKIVQAETGIMDYTVRHSGGKALWKLKNIARPSGYNLIYFDSRGEPVVNDTAEHTVEIGEDIYLYGFLTRSSTGLNLELQDNGAGDPYGSWITRRAFTVVRTSSEKTS